MIDQAKKRKLIEHIDSFGATSAQELMLGVDTFFDGYDDPCCTICANNRVKIPTSVFRDRLKEIGRKEGVAGLFVRFYDYRDAKEFESCWIGSDSVYLITSSDFADVRAWFADFEVSDVWEKKDLSRFVNLPTIPAGHRVVTVWWD